MITVIPDVHGRDFWNEAEKLTGFSGKVIFLGDYIAPYPYGEITEKTASVNFLRILEFKKANPDKVVLLLGNHAGLHPGYLREMKLTEEYSAANVRAMDFSQILTEPLCSRFQEEIFTSYGKLNRTEK